MLDSMQIKIGYNFLDVKILYCVYLKNLWVFFKLMKYICICGMCNNIMKNDLLLCVVKLR